MVNGAVIIHYSYRNDTQLVEINKSKVSDIELKKLFLYTKWRKMLSHFY